MLLWMASGSRGGERATAGSPVDAVVPVHELLVVEQVRANAVRCRAASEYRRPALVGSWNTR